MPNFDRSDADCEALLAKRLPHFHVVRLNDRLKTPGSVNFTNELTYLGLGRDVVAGKSLLDTGANDGSIAFAAERAGASRVLAVDVEDYERYDWGFGGAPKSFTGKGNVKNRVFDELKTFFSSSVERKKKTVYDLDPTQDGSFDFVFFYGLLYHLRHPLLAFDKLRPVCKSALFVETHVCPAHSALPMTLFYHDDVLAKSITNWTGPTEACVVHWMKDAGFKSIWVEKDSVRPMRQRFIGFVDEPTYAVPPVFTECKADYFQTSRAAIEKLLA